jgi:hypothetical protein
MRRPETSSRTERIEQPEEMTSPVREEPRRPIYSPKVVDDDDDNDSRSTSTGSDEQDELEIPAFIRKKIK